CQHHNDYPVTF
nr:immunoglobulin light chain junction region [Macaca mulatta]